MRAALAAALACAGCFTTLDERELTGGTPSTCPVAGVALCDGFEGGVLAAAWARAVDTGTLAADGTRPYRGGGSLHARSAPTGGGELVRQDLSARVVAGGDFYARAYVYLPSPLPPTDFRLMAVQEGQMPFAGPGLFVSPEGKLEVQYPSAATVRSQTDAPVDRWWCLEWQLKDGAPGLSRVWLDGAELADLKSTAPTQAATPLVNQHVGLVIYTAPALPAHDWFFDEVILDGAPIGCTK